jgi:phage gpG-like protein
MAKDFNKLNEIARRLEQNQTRLVRAMAAQAITFSKQRFREKAWVDNRTEPWKKRKPGAPREKGRTLLVDSGRLRDSIHRISITRNSAIIGTDVPYARIHNEGGMMHPHVTRKMRGFAWKMYYATKQDKWKGLALTKKETLNIRIPKRKFMGNSAVQNRQIKRVLTLQINKILR